MNGRAIGRNFFFWRVYGRYQESLQARAAGLRRRSMEVETSFFTSLVVLNILGT